MEDSQDYGSPVNEDSKVEKLNRRLSSIRSSMSFRLGNLIVKSVIRPLEDTLPSCFSPNFTMELWSRKDGEEEQFGVNEY